MSAYEETLTAIRSIVDTYHGQQHSVHDLITLRRELAGHYFYLTTHVKEKCRVKEVSSIQRKWNTSAEIVAAMTKDLKAGGKPTPMNRIEIQTEALNHVLVDKTTEAEALAVWEEIKAVSRSISAVLDSMQQEIANARQENQRAAYLDGLSEQQQEQEHP